MKFLMGIDRLTLEVHILLDVVLIYPYYDEKEIY